MCVRIPARVNLSWTPWVRFRLSFESVLYVASSVALFRFPIWPLFGLASFFVSIFLSLVSLLLVFVSLLPLLSLTLASLSFLISLCLVSTLFRVHLSCVPFTPLLSRTAFASFAPSPFGFAVQLSSWLISLLPLSHHVSTCRPPESLP